MSPSPLDKSILLALGLVGATACACLDIDTGVCLSEEPDTDTDTDSDSDSDSCLAALFDEARPGGFPGHDVPPALDERDQLIERLGAAGALPADVVEQI